MSAAAGGLSQLPQVSDGVCLGHAHEQMHKVAGPKAGSQAELQMHLQNLGESLYQVVVWGLLKALPTSSPSPKCSVPEGKVAREPAWGSP